MDSRSLGYFKAVYERRSISAAADALFISHQGLSKAIKGLEDELGRGLFVRSPRGVEPTAFARAIYPKAIAVCDACDSIAKAAAGEVSEAPMRVIATAGYLSYIGGTLREGYARSHGGRDLEVHEAPDLLVSKAVIDGEMECGCMAGPVDHSQLDAWLVSSHPFVLVVNENDPLARRDAIDLADLGGKVLATMGRGYSPLITISDKLVRAGVTPARHIGVAEVAAGLYYVERNEGVHITADFAALANLKPGVVVRPFSDPSFTWDVFFVVSKWAAPSGEALDLRDYLVSSMPSLFAGPAASVRG